MTVSAKVFYAGGQLANAATALFTAPVNIKADVITAATFTNTDTVPHVLTVYLVRSGGAPTVANALISGMNLAAGQAYVSPELQGQTLSSGDAIQALADAASKITCAGISGYEVT